MQSTGSETPRTHVGHAHRHGPGCGHKAIRHDGHADYLHEGHLHAADGAECTLVVSATNPEPCTPAHDCGAHAKDHVHDERCGHERVPHGDHVDFLVEGHLHHAHGAHCDDHGKIAAV